MNEIPDIMRLASGAARHAAARQATIAANVANADTPGFHARDTTPFTPEDDFTLRRTRPGHLAGQALAAQSMELRDVPADPNGNTVDLEDQILRGIDASRQHERALSVYSGALDILRSSIGKR